jgi:hypothetical protein
MGLFFNYNYAVWHIKHLINLAMADDISKNIIIKVEADTDQVKQGINELNQSLDTLLQMQTQLAAAGQQNSKTFQDIAAQVKTAQAAIDKHTQSVIANAKTLGSANKTFSENKALMASLLQQHDKLSNAQGNHTKRIEALNTQIVTLSNTITGQVTNLTSSKSAATLDLLSSGFDKLKGVSGTFGPSLEDAAKGFSALKDGLSIVQTGFTSVGEAIKTTGFGLLVLVLQSVVDYFTKTTEGSAILRGAISAVGVVVNTISLAFTNLGKFIVDAVTHPIENLKALGNMIKENIINRFKAFSVILDGIIHLDFKKMADGAIQAFTGVTHATDKIKTAAHAVTTAVKGTVGEMVSAYKEGYKQAGKHVESHKNKTISSNNALVKSYKEVKKAVEDTVRANSNSESKKLISKSGGVSTSCSLTADATGGFNENISLENAQGTANKKVELEKTALQKVEYYAKQSTGKIASDALNALNNSIKQQSDAKISALEKDKASELGNKSLTGAQKLAIEAKFKKQEALVKVKAFKQEQEASIAQAVINGAMAITKAEAQTGVLGALVIPAIIAGTAVQIAKIASQKPPAYAHGGLHYNSDGRGGVLSGYSRTDNTNAYLRSGEGIVVSEAMQVPWARNLVSAINVGFGGRDFSIKNPGQGYAVGGIFTDGGDANRYYNQPVNDQKNLANTIAYQMINNFPPVYVDVKDVNNQQNILAQTINRVNL